MLGKDPSRITWVRSQIWLSEGTRSKEARSWVLGSEQREQLPQVLTSRCQSTEWQIPDFY